MDRSSSSSWTSPESPRAAESVTASDDVANTLQFRRVRDRSVCPNFFERKRFTTLLNTHFPALSRCHGALYTRVVLWGLAGSGKRQIATHFTLNRAISTGQVVLWVEADSIEAFVRDYRNAYVKLTGLPTPKNLPLSQLLRKIQRTLEARHSEWFLVLFDAQPSMENPNNSFGLSVVDYLPERGHVLITTSCIIIETNSDSANSDVVSCAIQLGDTAEMIFVDDMDEDEGRQHIRSLSLATAGLDLSIDQLRDSFGLWPLRLVLSWANMSMMGFTARQYDSHFSRKFAKMSNPKDLEQVRTMSPRFSVTMNIAWDIVNDLDQAAVDLIVCISVVGAMEIPIELLKNLAPFQRAVDHRLYRAIDLLSSMSLIMVHDSDSAAGTISMHGLAHRFLSLKINPLYDNRYAIFVSDWIRVLSDYLTPEDAVGKPAKFWDILPHFRQVIRAATKLKIQSSSLATLLRNVAQFLVSDGFFYHVADIFSSQAIGIFLLNPGKNYRRLESIEYVLTKELRARALLGLFKIPQATDEINDALRRLPKSNVVEMVKDTVRKRLLDLKVDILMEAGQYTQAEAILHVQLLSDGDEFKTARRHFKLAGCFDGMKDSTSRGMRHSHAALSYWSKRADKWDESEMWEWVDHHGHFMITYQKGKGALQIFTQVLERYLQSYPLTCEKIWRTVFCIVNCHNVLGMKDEAEALAIRILSKVSVPDLHGIPLTFCLMMLNQLAEILQAHGRLVEAGAIYRHNVHVACTRSVPSLSGPSSYNYSADRLDLMLCLRRQERIQEAEYYHNQFLQLGLNDDFTESINLGLKDYRQECSLYQSAYEALCSGHSIKWAPNFTSKQSAVLKSAKRRFGSLKDRLRENQDPLEDLDLIGFHAAEKSRVLNLLGLNLVYLICADREGIGFFCMRENQNIIGQYFNSCQCRRARKRSQSLHPMDIIDKGFQIKDDPPKPEARRLKQTLLTDWLDLGHESLKELDKSESFPGSLDSMKAEKKREAPTPAKVLDVYGTTWKLKDPKFFRWADNDTLIFNGEQCLSWVPAAFKMGDHKDENYIIENALALPSIVIRSPPQEDHQKDVGLLDLFRVSTPEIDPLGKFVIHSPLNCRHPTQLEDILEEDDKPKEESSRPATTEE